SAILLYSGEINNPDLTWGHATRALLGPLNMGLIGLMLASMIAALMSTADCLMLTVSGLIVNNLYKPFAKNPTEKELIFVG
ncbi:MAG: sodium:solute symporter family protein, partial [Bacteroidota bacterium]